jgi:hypothetical protein
VIRKHVNSALDWYHIAGYAAQLFRSAFVPRPVAEPNAPYRPYGTELKRYNANGVFFFLATQKEMLVPHDTWFSQEVIANGPHIVVLHVRKIEVKELPAQQSAQTTARPALASADAAGPFLHRRRPGLH